MAREIESTHAFTTGTKPWQLEKQVVVMRCGDGAVYEFEKPTDGRKQFRLARRFDPSGELSTSRAILPGAVTETAESIFGKGGWFK